MIIVIQCSNRVGLVDVGKEIEIDVLTNALKMVFEGRVFVYNNKTVVFD